MVKLIKFHGHSGVKLDSRYSESQSYTSQETVRMIQVRDVGGSDTVMNVELVRSGHILDMNWLC